ncbi:hypothetical protein PGTUg99_011306 [Puccinia graminis f. sp. tritici]|uniref:Uncharacterized protein n=1 Tax=Puccinia graminis f. sp. tritici TaxID=56615 RepID=A0A5B0SIL0_PUCGR|nr:hypothetical protein PGTUg99_011306 [Puccinia graminis f. sp. tritici]
MLGSRENVSREKKARSLESAAMTRASEGPVGLSIAVPGLTGHKHLRHRDELIARATDLAHLEVRLVLEHASQPPSTRGFHTAKTNSMKISWND